MRGVLLNLVYGFKNAYGVVWQAHFLRISNKEGISELGAEQATEYMYMYCSKPLHSGNCWLPKNVVNKMHNISWYIHVQLDSQRFFI